MKQINVSWWAWIYLFFLSLVWGSSFILIKKALIGLSPIHVALLRVIITFIAFIPFLLVHFVRIKARQWPYVALVGLIGNGFPAILYATAQTKVLSATAGILNALTPIFTLVLGVMIFKSRMRGHQVLGTAVGFIGAALLFVRDLSLDSFNSFTLLIVLATMCYGMSVNIVQHRLQDLKPLTIASGSFLFVGLICSGWLLVDPIPPLSDQVVLTSVAAVTVLSLFSTFLATMAFYRLVQISDALFASSVSYIAPVVALLWGLADGELLDFRHVMALVMVLLGVFLIRFKV
ncbi:MAG: DMT family transporter [Saprospiraceae bacterium]|nr:DMT family transporter [Saprospiraceae bacterium]